MHFYGITVVIISKFGEVMKSETKIVLINYNTHVHTLGKTILFFWISSFLAKTKGEGRSPSAKKTHFFGPTEISGRLCGRGPHKLAEWNVLATLTTICRGFEFEWETKKLWSFKVSQLEILKNRGYPPLKWNNQLETPLPGMLTPRKNLN